MGTVVIIGESRAGELIGGLPKIAVRDFACVDCEDAVVILGKNAHCEVKNALSVIADGDEPAELPRGVQLITCGVSPKNTVSVTSRTPERLTLSLNRSIRTAKGVVEPLELPAPVLQGFSEYDIMANFAVQLLENSS